MNLYSVMNLEIYKYVCNTKIEWDVVQFTPCPVERAPQYQLLIV